MEEYYQKIFEIIKPYLPKKWEKLVFMANYSKGSYSMSFYVKKGDKYIDYHDLGYRRDELIKLFISINNIVSPIRNKLPEKELWYTFTISIDSDGSFKADYDYDDISENFVAYKREWRDKYLV